MMHFLRTKVLFLTIAGMSLYMSKEDLENQIADGVEFWAYKEDEKVLGVMGIQDKRDVTLIRHAYVKIVFRNKRIGGKLIGYLIELTDKPVLIGTWAAAKWAIDFYHKHRFTLLPDREKNKLLGKYWTIPQRQMKELSSQVPNGS